MRLLLPCSLLPLLSSSVLSIPTNQGYDHGSKNTFNLEAWIQHEKQIALQGVLANIGPKGSKVPGAAAGIIVASPSKVNPDYFFTWSRDAALTLKTLVDEFIFGHQELQSVIEDYIHSQAVLQTVSNPSGTLQPLGLGLGEPKYQVTGLRFNGAWGRPQRDGPALRAIALISYSNWLVEHRQSKKAKEIVWPIIANDLSYVGQYWNATGFDLWEEVSGSSFFTVQAQYKSLIEGATLAKTLGTKCTGCEQAPQVLCFLQSFWNGEYVVANINTNTARSGKDGNTILGPIAVFDLKAPCEGHTFQPCASKSLANFKVLVDSFREAYALNKEIAKDKGVAVGRYTEDTYQGGNPWYLITFAAAELLYDAVAQWKSHKSLTITPLSLPFFTDLLPSIKTGTYRTSSRDFSKITTAVLAYADSFIAVAAKHTPTNGSLAEQFARDTGAPLSASDLTWSYASLLTLQQRRKGQFPAPWLPSSPLSALPKICLGTSTLGVYAPATAAGAPNSTLTCTVPVLFNLNATTYYGENIYVVGNSSVFGDWDFSNSQPLNPGNYSSERPLWYAEVQMPAGKTVSYTYVRQEDCGQAEIYETLNRTVTVPPCGGAKVTTDEAWTGPLGTSGGC